MRRVEPWLAYITNKRGREGVVRSYAGATRRAHACTVVVGGQQESAGRLT